MSKLFTIFTIVFALSFIAGLNVNAQDAPISIGLAPYVYNNVEQSVVFDGPLPDSRGFSVNAASITSSQVFKYFLGTPGTFTNVGAISANFLGSGDFGGPSNLLYMISQISPYVLYSVDTTTGVRTTVATITGIDPGHSAGGITSCAWDQTTNTMFIESTAITSSKMYSLDLTTGVATPIGGLITNAPGIIAMACNTTGQLYAIDIVNDNLWSMNKTTGAATLVGPLGYNANYGQDADFDPHDDVLYWAAIGTGVTQLRTINTTTGMSALVGNFTGQNQVLATGIPGASGPPPTPQYWNYENVGTSSNTFPFGQAAGKAVNYLFLPNTFVNPTPVPTGQAITDVYFFITTGGTRTFTDFEILMAQTTSTDLTTGQFYAGPWDTVYTSASSPQTWTTNSWSTPITLDTPFPYDPTKSLVVFLGQCGGPGSGMYVRNNTAPGGIKRTWSVGGCPFVPYAGGDASTLNFGFNVTPYSGITPVSNIPDKFSLSQNYPNPFNPTTTINYSIPKSGLVTLKVYNVLGKEVATLVNEVKNAGSYAVNFGGFELTSGTYFYKIEAGDFTDVKKMILLK